MDDFEPVTAALEDLAGSSASRIHDGRVARVASVPSLFKIGLGLEEGGTGASGDFRLIKTGEERL